MNPKIDLLKVLHDNLMTLLALDNKLVQNSVLLSFFNFKSNIRFNYLLKAAQNADNIPDIIIKDLLESGDIREIGDMNNYTITGKGIWEIERDYKLTENQLINFIDTKYFVVESENKDLSDKEKVILLSLIAIRAFSGEFCIDLKRSEYLLESMKRIIDASHEILFDLGVITMQYSKLYGKKGNEHMVSNLIRHTDSLPKKTKSFFYAPGDQKYYLNIIEGGTIGKKDLLWLLKRILGKNVITDLEQYDRLKTFFNTIPYKEGYFVFENIDKSFVNHEIDDLIEVILKEMIFEF